MNHQAKKTLLNTALIYLVAGGLDRAVPFLTLPVFAYYLTSEELGIVSLFVAALGVINILMSLSMDGAVCIFYFQDSEKTFKNLVGNIYSLVLFSCVLLLLGVNLFNSPLSHLLSLSPLWLNMLVLASLGLTSHLILTSLLRSQKRAIPYGILQISKSLLDVGGALILIIGYDLSWQGRILALTSANFFFGLLAFFYLWSRSYIAWGVSQELQRKLWNFGVPLIPHAMGGWIIAASDRFFVNNMVSLEEVGRYHVGYTIGMLVAVLTQAFNQAWAPHLFSKLANVTKGEKLKLVRYTYLYMLVIFGLVPVLTLVGQFILRIFFGEEYQGANQYIFIVSLTYAVEGLYFMVANYLLFVKRGGLLSVGTVIAALLNGLLNYFLIQMYGAVGAAYATLSSFAVLFILTFIFAYKVYPMPWFFWKKGK